MTQGHTKVTIGPKVTKRAFSNDAREITQISRRRTKESKNGRIHGRRKGEVLIISEDPEIRFKDIDWLDEEEVDVEFNTDESACVFKKE